MTATRILVIDNDEAIRDMFSLMLSDDGYEVFNTKFPDVTLDFVQEVNPDLIILDLNAAQKGTGWAFLQLLKMEDKTATIPILVCTTSTHLSLDIEGYLAVQHIQTVRKPFALDALILVVQQALVPAEPPALPISKVLPILVVEDDPTLRLLITTILNLEGYQVDYATNGRLALDAVAHSQYSVILLDMAMPEMDGSEFLAVYTLQEGVHTPVIIVSGQEGLMTRKFSSLVTDRLSKPFEPEDLLKLVSKYAQPIPGALGLNPA